MKAQKTLPRTVLFTEILDDKTNRLTVELHHSDDPKEGQPLYKAMALDNAVIPKIVDAVNTHDRLNRDSYHGDRSSIEMLRLAVSNFNHCQDGWSEQFSIAELLLIHDMWLASDWDFLPDTQWTQRQLDEALQGVVPRWDPKTEKPIYAKKASDEG